MTMKMNGLYVGREMSLQDSFCTSDSPPLPAALVTSCDLHLENDTLVW